MKINELSPEQLEQARKCKTLDEYLEFFSQQQVELTDEQLDAISAGLSNSATANSTFTCPRCGKGFDSQFDFVSHAVDHLYEKEYKPHEWID